MPRPYLSRNKPFQRRPKSKGPAEINAVIKKFPSGYIKLEGLHHIFLRNDDERFNELANGDKVKFVRFKDSSRKPEMVPESISKRALDSTIVRLVYEHGHWFGYQVIKGHPDRIFINESSDLVDGAFAKVALQPKIGVKHYVTELLGSSIHEVQKTLGEVSYQVPVEQFSDAILNLTAKQQAEDRPSSDENDQVPWQFVTIDGEDAKDLDDAIWAKPTDQGFDVAVAIADVSHYVKPDSELDEEAADRANSFYRRTQVYPMLPVALSNDLCSLHPGEAKRCVVLAFSINHQGDPVGEVTVSRHALTMSARLSYEQVNEWDTKLSEGQAIDWPFSGCKEVVESLYQAASAMLSGAEKNGLVKYDPNRGQINASGVVEQCMVMANRLVARHLDNKLSDKTGKRRGLYRTLLDPDKGEWSETIRALADISQWSIHPKHFPKPTASYLNELFVEIDASPYKSSLLQTLMGYMGRAEYRSENRGHFMLGLQDYTHFTSPIRRYIDLCIHRLLLDEWKFLPKKAADIICDQANLRHQSQKQLERFDDDYRLMRALQVLATTQKLTRVLVKFSRISLAWQLNDYHQRNMGQVFSGQLVGFIDEQGKPIYFETLDETLQTIMSPELRPFSMTSIGQLFCIMDRLDFGAGAEVYGKRHEIYLGDGEGKIDPSSVFACRLVPEAFDFVSRRVRVKPEVPFNFFKLAEEGWVSSN